MVATLKRPKPTPGVNEPAGHRTKSILPVEFKFDESTPGAFRATFALFNNKDLDGDVTIPGAFTAGAPVRIAQWGHNWYVPAIGKGVIGADGERAWVDGQFNLNMTAGKETYEAVKALGDLQQWSYGFDIDDAGPGDFNGEKVNLLRKLTVHEISPVMLGAQPLTSTDRIKGQKVGRRNAAADLAMMEDIAGRLQEALDLMAQLMGDTEDEDTSSANDDGSDEGKASKGGSSKAEDRSRETTAARIALELLELDT